MIKLDNVSEQIELKPCPFCGGKKLKIYIKRMYGYGTEKKFSVTVRCEKCRARSPIVTVNIPHTEHEERKNCEKVVTEAWNRRAENA